VKPKHPYGAVAVWWVVFFALVPGMCAQEAPAPRHTGVPQDWSQRHIVFSRDALALHPDLIYREPRILHQAMQRWQVPNSGGSQGADPALAPADNSGPQRDWNVAALGGRLNPDMFPAKFSFDPAGNPDCANDYVVFGLFTASTGTQANLVAFHNLYVGAGGYCGAGPKPTVLFAYNITTVTGGKIVTSPVLSEDGTKIAFVESVPGPPAQAIFHVVTWAANAPGNRGAIGAAVVPVSMTSLTFSPSAHSPSAANDTTSSPWVDYRSDTAYVGADNGVVYKITGVFNGTPTLVGLPWPVSVSPNFHLTPPVLDSVLGWLMVGSRNGKLYQINPASGTLVKTLPVGAGTTNHGILAAPIVDITNGTTFVVSSNNGTSAVLVEADTATLTLLSAASIGLGSASGTAVNLYEPAFDNNYYNNPSTGLIHLCGTGPADITPWQYAFPFTGRTMQTTASVSQQLPTIPANSTAARCTGWTEFFNPNIGPLPGTDFFFFGLSRDCTATGAAGGCVEALSINGATTTTKTATITGGPTGIIVDNSANPTNYPQASSIYFAANGVNTAYKFTQSGLN